MIPEDLLASTTASLTEAGIPNARKEARMLWDASNEQEMDFQQLLARRLNREPMSHITGWRDFYNHRFLVTSAVLDPRPDTETLVHEALKVPFRRVLDLGTGTGCIVLSLLAENKKAQGLGVDASKDALTVAAQNCAMIGLDDRCDFKPSNWFSNVEGQFDLIVSNPPYIAASEMEELQPEVRLFEPRIALTDEGDGLGAYRAITEGLDPYLAPNGSVLMEIGPTQATAVSEMMRSAGLVEIVVHQDLDGRDRVVQARKPA